MQSILKIKYLGLKISKFLKTHLIDQKLKKNSKFYLACESGNKKNLKM